MPRKKISTGSLTTALGASVLQWAIDSGFGDKTVSELHATLINGKVTAPKKATKKKKKTATKKKKTATKKKSIKKKSIKKKATKKKATKKKATKKKATKKKSIKGRKTGASKFDPQAVVTFIKKHGKAKAADLKGLVPDNANARAQFLGGLVEQKLIRREGKARGTTYFPG